MCVIAVKPAGIDMPTDQRIKDMWDKNPDGAGYMYLDNNGNVMIHKGFMTLDDFKKDISELTTKNNGNLKDVPMVMHFRITTHGGTSPENTHPFPVSSDEVYLKALNIRAKMGIAHNGIINTVKDEKDLSDTQIYIRDVLSAFRNHSGDNFVETHAKVIENSISSSRLAFLDSDGKITTIGNFKSSDDNDGLKYSNTRHEPVVYTPRKYSSYGDGYAKYGYHKITPTYVDKMYDEALEKVGKNVIVRQIYYNMFKDTHGETVIYDDYVLFDVYKQKYTIVYDIAPVINGVIDYNRGVFGVSENYITFTDKYDTQISLLYDTEEKEVRANNIGGRDNEETKDIKMNANRKYLRSLVAKDSSAKFRRISKNILLSFKDSKETLKTKSYQWYSDKKGNVYYRAKDGDFIHIRELEQVNIRKATRGVHRFNKVRIWFSHVEDKENIMEGVDVR